MTTTQLVILCLTALATVMIVVRALVAHDQARAQHQRETAMHERATARPVADLAAAVETLAAAAAALERVAGERAPSRVGQRVTVHTKRPDDQTLYGVVVGDYTDLLVLEDASYVTTAGPTALPGRQEIAQTTIAWLDVHGRVAVPDVAPAAV